MGSCMAKQDTSKASAVAPYTSPQSKIPRLRLFGAELCPFTARVCIALQYKGILFRSIWLTSEDLKGNNLDVLATVCPDGKLPVLQHENQTICGSNAILEYIEATFPNPSLIGGSSLSKDIQEWVAYVRDTFTPLIGQILYDGNPFIQQDLAAQLDAAFARLDGTVWEHSARGPFFFGDQFSLVDVYLIPFLLLVRPLTYFRGIDISPVHSYLLSYSKRMHAFPAYVPVRMDLQLLEMTVGKVLAERAPPPLVLMTILQHRSISCHMEKLVQQADELAASRQNVRVIDPAKGSIGMQIRKLSTGYGQLLVLMQEHAQMEEQVIFPALEKADRGVSKSANENHARDLPMMNGIREDMKAVLALEHGSPIRAEALLALAIRLRTLQALTIEHFHEEERELLPLLIAAGVGSKQQAALVARCLNIMELSHSQALPYLLSGLCPHEIHQYMDLLQRCLENGKPIFLMRIMEAIRYSDEEFEFIWRIVQERLPTLAARLDKGTGA